LQSSSACARGGGPAEARSRRSPPSCSTNALTVASFVRLYTTGSLPSHCCEESRLTLAAQRVTVLESGVPAPNGPRSLSVSFPAFCLVRAKALLSSLARRSMHLAREAVPPLASVDGVPGGPRPWTEADGPPLLLPLRRSLFLVLQPISPSPA